MSNVNQQLNTPALPDLPNPQERYDRLTVAQTNAALRTFFLKVVNAFTSLLGPAGARYIDSPNGLFFSTSAQTLAATNTKYDITFDQTYLNNYISVVDSSKITCAVGGIYNFQFSGQAKSTNSSAKQIYLMINRDGTDIGYTTRQNTLSGSDQHMSVNWNFSIDVSAGSYIKLRWAGDSTDLRLEATAATSPHTGIPSAVLAVNYLAPLPTTLPTPP
jgi:hypothetical protein